MSVKLNRRNFLKLMGWGGAGTALAGCDMPTTVTLEEGEEEVVSYLAPEEFVIPGVGVWYASTCQQCSAACGIHGRVREGRALKLEGNPESAVNAGKLCQMGQAALQGHYSPDRITQPMLREGGSLKVISWQKANSLLNDKVAGAGTRLGWFTGGVSGHQAVLIDAHLSAAGSKHHYVHEVVGSSVLQAVNKDMLGDASPRWRLDKAKMVLSFGADFLGTWESPVHLSGQYNKFRSGDRGLFVAAESKMSMTGANADLWLAIRPGTEGQLALGIANELINKLGVRATLPAEMRAEINRHSVANVAKLTGVSEERIQRVAKRLSEKTPSLVLPGAPVEGSDNGYGAVASVMLLNLVLGNVGKTIQSAGTFPFPQMAARRGSTKDLLAFSEAVAAKKLDVVLFYGSNPLFTAPKSLALDEKLAGIGFKVAIASHPDETTEIADLVLPAASPLESWGTHVAVSPAGKSEISFQQPLMEKMHPEVKGFGDIALDLVKARGVSAYQGFADYYAYLRHAVAAMPASYKAGVKDDAFWNGLLQSGTLTVANKAGGLTEKVVSVKLNETKQDSSYPFTLIPSPRLGLLDGRHANLPWLQESPDHISKVVWDSWAEMHPSTAKKLSVKHGDIIRIASAQGEIKAKVYLFKGIHPDAVAVPLGQGHESYGRFATGIGANPLKILNPVTDSKTGELSMYATRVNVSNTGENEKLVSMGGSDRQAGRRLVGTVSADVLRRTEGG